MKKKKKEIKVGTWIRFYQAGELVIGKVEYIKVDPVLGNRTFSTDQGAAEEDDVLEFR